MYTLVAMDLYQDLEARGLIKQITDPSLADELRKGPITLYCGFDPTSDSLHVGSLLPLLILRRFQLAGHRIIAVVGGATGMIGDPSFKAQERALLTQEQLEKNLRGIRRAIDQILDLSPPSGARVENNYDWIREFSFLGFLRDIGKHFSVNIMLAKDSVKQRLEDREQGISYTEFSYMLLQAYDFEFLLQRHGCRLQIGGSDQWGNITAGCELIRRMGAARGKPSPEVYGLTFPLVTKADGSKYGKSESGNVWLAAEKTSPYQFYQFFLQTADADVGKLLKYFSLRPLTEIDALLSEFARAPEKREAQKALARELTEMLHGADELRKVEAATQALFGGDLSALDATMLSDVFAEAPSTEKARSVLSGPGYALAEALADTGLCGGKGAARKDLQAGGIYVNNERVQDPAATLTEKHLMAGRFIVLRKGKKTYHLLKF